MMAENDWAGRIEMQSLGRGESQRVPFNRAWAATEKVQ